METRYPPFAVTPTAIRKIEDVGGCVRIDLVDGGCCGTAYDFAVHPGASTDEVFGCEGAWLLVSRDAMAILPGTKLDYSDRVRPPRFRVIHNPNTPERCPCNRSFGSAWPGRCQPTCRAKTPMPWDS
ncbi:MAG: iron-sulfur cluster assembly accessory protein [Chloroflexota bacterium]|nr:iron-sulfur cluster assembly accessory protein [Chloroflexota bacterium]